MSYIVRDTELFPKLFDLKRVGIKLGLDRIREILNRLGNPQDDYHTIHVAGTNGKGSVCRMISSILLDAGYSVGIYTSPHLVNFKERFVVNGKELDNKEIQDVVNLVMENAEDIKDVTFFEISTSVAFEIFRRKRVDFGIIETGMGGRYDATNVISPLITVITRIAEDHQEYLGNRIEDIAREKAGIIKDNIPVLTSADGKALEIIREIAETKSAELITVKERWKRKDFDLGGQIFDIRGILRDYEIEIPLLGRFQGENVALAVLSVEKLQMLGIYLPDGCIENGLRKVKNPGRMELVSKNPFVILDGAHNVDAMKSLSQSLDDFNYDRLILVLGILKDKDVEGMIKEIVPKSDIVITSMPKNERALSSREISKIIRRFYPDFEVKETNSIEEAIFVAKEMARSKDLICVTGSLYTVGEARTILIPEDYSVY